MFTRKYFKRFIMLIIASILYSIGVSLFLDPNNLAPGGITGISILLNRFLPIETGTLILLLNIPLLIIAWKKFGWKFVASTFATLLMISVFTNILDRFDPLTDDLFLAAIAGGGSMALGLGIVLKNGATTGGTDIVVKLLRLKYRHLKTGFLFFAIDIVIISFSIIVFKNLNQALYATVSLFVMSQVMDMVLYGKDEARLIYIVSEKSTQIAERFLKEIEIGVTFLNGKGAYTNAPKQIIMCVMKKRLGPKAEEIVKEIDPKAFLIITSASEIYGEGYKSYHSAIL